MHTGRESPIILFSVPDGHTKEMPTAGGPKKTGDISVKEVSCMILFMTIFNYVYINFVSQVVILYASINCITYVHICGDFKTKGQSVIKHDWQHKIVRFNWSVVHVTTIFSPVHCYLPLHDCGS